MVGIKRIHIIGTAKGRGAWRFKDAKKCWPANNKVYQDVFGPMGLIDGYELIECTKKERDAMLDTEFGIDVLLYLENGLTLTLQEKNLFTTYNTITVEYMQDWRKRIQGDWFNLRCQYYFVGYDSKKRGLFDDWIILDWGRTQLETSQNRLCWATRNNHHDGALASFRWVYFDSIPDVCVVARMPTIKQATLWDIGNN